MMQYFNCHNHTMYSNLRLLDSIIRPKALIDKAIELGLSGVAITDHEALCAWMEINQYAQTIKEKNPDFKIALGNEIYLTDTRARGQKYYHFILIAKDAIGTKGIRELSSMAWDGMYNDRNMDRVPLLKTELAQVMPRYKGHIIATTACLGGELSTLLLEYDKASWGDQATIEKQISNFITFCLEQFGDDFYIECAPALSEDQIAANRALLDISRKYSIPLVVGTDSHYLTEKDRPIHSAYLTSKDGDRETDVFYKYAYLMDYNEVFTKLSASFGPEEAKEVLANTSLIYDKIESYSLARKQIIPKVEVPAYPSGHEGYLIGKEDRYPVLCSLLDGDNDQEKYWANECYMSLFEKMYNKQIPEDKLDEYLDRLEIEANVIKKIGEDLEDCLFAYFNTFKHYIDLFWDCGSIVGPGRGSATGFLSNFLLGITQLDPIRWSLPWWRLTLT